MSATFIKLRISETQCDAFFNVEAIDRFDENEDGGFDIEYQGTMTGVDTDPREAEYVEIPARGDAAFAIVSENRKKLDAALAHLKAVTQEAAKLKLNEDRRRFLSQKDRKGKSN